MSAYRHVQFDQLKAAHVVIRGMAFWPDGDMEGSYVDLRRLRREIRRARDRVRFLSDGSPFYWGWLARKFKVRP